MNTPADTKPQRPQRAMQVENPDAFPLTAPQPAQAEGVPLAEEGRAAFPQVRSGLGAFAKRLEHPPIPDGWKARWINDEPGRIDAAKRDGYVHVMDENQKPLSRVFGVSKLGGPLTAMLMKIPVALYDHWQKLKQEPIDALDDSIRRGEVGNQDGRYLPKDAHGKPKIKIES